LFALVDIARAQIEVKNHNAKNEAALKARQEQEAEDQLFLQIKYELETRRDFAVPVKINVPKQVSAKTLVKMKEQSELWLQIKPIYACKICGKAYDSSPSPCPFMDRYCAQHRCKSCGQLVAEGTRCGGCYS
jgi:hypothetical protein